MTHTHTYTLGMPPLDEGSARRRDLYWRHTTLTSHRYPCPRRDSSRQSQQVSGSRLQLSQRGQRDWLVLNINNWKYRQSLFIVAIHYYHNRVYRSKFMLKTCVVRLSTFRTREVYYEGYFEYLVVVISREYAL